MSASSRPIVTVSVPREKREYFHWVIEDYSLLREDPLNRYYSPVFVLGGHTWRILLFPNGNKSPHYVSAYLEVAEQHLLPTGWTREATFQLTSPISNFDKAVRHWFDSQRSDWGFLEFIPRHQQHDARTQAKDDTLTIEVWVETHVEDVKHHPLIDQHFPGATKTLKESGYAGPQSLGAYQYLNSVIMMLFHLAAFRSSVYALETDGDAINATARIALQRMFYQLQRAEKSGVDQSHLAKALGWSTFDSWDEQRNVACFLPHLFSSVFGAAQLPWFLHAAVDVDQASLTAHGAHALQVAVSELPPPPQPPQVLCVGLNRFRYDAYGCKRKLTTAFGYSPSIEFAGAAYQLHAVLVHNGHPHGGHYHCYIRPTAEPRWFNFDDELVVAARDDAEAFDANFGGPRTTSHAYLLLYVLSSSSVVAPLDATPISEALQLRFSAEDEADHRNRLQQREHLLFMDVRVATLRDLEAHDQSSAGIVDFDRVATFRVKKNTWLCDFKQIVEQAIGVPAPAQRWWSWSQRENGTFRPDGVVVPASANGETDLCKLTYSSDWCVFVENVEQTPCLRKDNDATCSYIFIKQYDAAATAAQPLRFVGGVMIDRYRSVGHLRDHCAALAGVAAADLLLFEEVTPNLVEPLDPGLAVIDAGLQNGDVVVFQRRPDADDNDARPRHPLCSDWYRHLAERVDVDFVHLPTSPHPSPTSDPVRLQLHHSDSYHSVAAALAQALSAASPDHVRLTGHNPLRGEPRKLPHLPSHELCLRDMLVFHFGAPTPLLYFELLPPTISMRDYERNRSLLVEWQPTAARYELLLPRSSTVADAVASLRELCPDVNADALLFSLPPGQRTVQPDQSPIGHDCVLADLDVFRSYIARPAGSAS